MFQYVKPFYEISSFYVYFSCNAETRGYNCSSGWDLVCTSKLWTFLVILVLTISNLLCTSVCCGIQPMKYLLKSCTKNLRAIHTSVGQNFHGLISLFITMLEMWVPYICVFPMVTWKNNCCTYFLWYCCNIVFHYYLTIMMHLVAYIILYGMMPKNNLFQLSELQHTSS
jgi:hypothetical protein